jgi:AcrR family transcriptional regulator
VTTTEKVETRDALLDAAERLFADVGIEGASLRSITSEAGANLASVNYHFGSKEGLVRAVLSRRFRPITEQRLAMLESCEARAVGGVLGLECVLRAFVAPVITMLAKDPHQGSHFIRFMGRLHAELDEVTEPMLTEQFGETLARFDAALRRALPGLAPDQIYWRFHFAMGAMLHTIACGRLLTEYTNGLCNYDDPEDVIRRLVEFMAAGMRGPREGSRA